MTFTKHIQGRANRVVQLANEGKLHGDDAPGSRKHLWVSAGRSVLRALAKELRLDDWQVSVSRGGPAVCADVYLRGTWSSNGNGIFIEFCQPELSIGWSGQRQFMWRVITAGDEGGNIWTDYQSLSNLEDVARDWVKKVRFV